MYQCNLKIDLWHQLLYISKEQHTSSLKIQEVVFTCIDSNEQMELIYNHWRTMMSRLH